MTNDLCLHPGASVEAFPAGPQAPCAIHFAVGSGTGLGRAGPSRVAAPDLREILTTAPEELCPDWQPVRELLERCRDDPALFNAEVLGRELWPKQVEVCAAVAHSPITLVPAGRAVGKSYLLAGLALWWLYTRPDGLVITTAPGFRLVASILWKELRKALRPRPDANRRPGPRFKLGFDHLSKGFGSPQQLEVRRGTSWGALGFSAESEEGFSGQHAGELLVIVDEASGILPPIWSAIHGLAASRLVVAGNPIRYGCHFRELHDQAVAGSPSLVTVPISTLESPDAGKDKSAVGLASLTFLNQMREIHGEDSPWWRANILGQFPSEESTRFIPNGWLDACTREGLNRDRRWLEYPAGDAWMGIDIGGGVGAGKSVIVVRNGKQLLDVFASEWHGVADDARHRLEPIVLDRARKWKVDGGRIIYDKGGLGRSFDSYLARHGIYDTIGYFGGGGGGKQYTNRRTASAFALKRRLDPHRANHVPFYCGGLPLWPQLRQELGELRDATMDMEEGRVKQALETKEALTKRLKHSPDLLDALLMSFTMYD